MQGYNGLTLFFRNNTELFMKAKFTTEEDHKFLHKLARETGSGEQAWRKAGVDHRDDCKGTPLTSSEIASAT